MGVPLGCRSQQCIARTGWAAVRSSLNHAVAEACCRLLVAVLWHAWQESGRIAGDVSKVSDHVRVNTPVAHGMTHHSCALAAPGPHQVLLAQMCESPQGYTKPLQQPIA